MEWQLHPETGREPLEDFSEHLLYLKQDPAYRLIGYELERGSFANVPDRIFLTLYLQFKFPAFTTSFSRPITFLLSQRNAIQGERQQPVPLP